MDRSSATALCSYTCLLLDRELKLARSVTLEAYTDVEAIEMASELLKEGRAGMPLVGFDLCNDGERALVPLKNSGAMRGNA
jgi:hypothetical protein